MRQALEGMNGSGEVSREARDKIGEAARELAEMEKEASRNPLQEKIRERQKNVLRKLLEAKESLEEKGYRRERKAVGAKDESALAPAPLPPELLELRKRALDARRASDRYPAQYRSIVDRYQKAIDDAVRRD